MKDSVRIALGVEYVGTQFRGWQTQARGVRSVQGVLESALSRVADHPVRVACAGRTDAGVHATQQIVHFESHAPRQAHNWVFGCNTNLPADLGVRWACQVPSTFHARFSALTRSYRYIIWEARTRPVVLHHKVTWILKSLDRDAMARAAEYLLGEHDFSSFRAAECQSRTPVRRIERIHVRRYNDFVVIDIEANAFLHHMVRNIAGLLIKIGHGDKPVGWCREVLEARDRRASAATAPAHGLYLVAVRYPQHYELPADTYRPRFW